MSALFRGRIERICVLVKVLMFCIEALKRILARHRGINASNDANGVGGNRVARALTPAAPHLSALNCIHRNACQARVLDVVFGSSYLIRCLSVFVKP